MVGADWVTDKEEVLGGDPPIDPEKVNVVTSVLEDVLGGIQTSKLLLGGTQLASETPGFVVVSGHDPAYPDAICTFSRPPALGNVEGETVKGGGALAHPTPVDAGAVSTMTATAAAILVDESRCGWRRDISHATRVRRCCGVKGATRIWLSPWERITMPPHPERPPVGRHVVSRSAECTRGNRARCAAPSPRGRRARPRRARRMDAARKVEVARGPRSGPSTQSGRVGEPGGRRDGRGAVGTGEQHAEVPRIAGGARR